MKGIYLASFKAYHPGYDICYQDINGDRDLDGDMMTVDLTSFDYVIATPPCNWWSRANYRRNISQYSLNTKYLLPCILFKLLTIKVPFIVENVRNDNFFRKFGLFDLPLYIYKIGRHTYWTNVNLVISDIHQEALTSIVDGKKKYLSSQNLSRKDRQGGFEVHQVIDRFLQTIHSSGI